MKRLKLELQANASSVETDLGSSDYSYLRLMLMDQEYAMIPGTQSFVAPTYLSTLNISNNTTSIEALNLKDQYLEERCLYLEYENVEKALMRHTQDTIQEKYLESLVDKYTNLILDNVPTVLDYLFYNYGKVWSNEVA